MIGKGKAISHTKASILYGWNQEKDAKVIFKQNLVGNTPEDLTKEFQFIQKLNTNCKRNTFSFVISPTIEDGEKIDSKTLYLIVEEFIKDLELLNRQAIAFVHLDKAHKHIHLYINRIDFNGKAYDDSYIGKRTSHAIKRVAKKLGLKTVESVRRIKQEQTKEVRKVIYNLHKKCIEIDNPRTSDDYIIAMKNYNIDVVPSISKSNQLRGFNYHYKNQKFKGSAVHREMSIKKVSALIKQLNELNNTIITTNGKIKRNNRTVN